MNDDYTYDLIEKFLDEKLSADEARTFKVLVESDEKFRAEVQQQLDTQSALQALYAANKKMKAPSTGRRIAINRTRLFMIASIAASLALLIVFVYTYQYFDRELKKSNLALEQKTDQQKILEEKINNLQLEISHLSETDSSFIKQSKVELEEKEKQIARLKEQLLNLQNGSTFNEKEKIAYAFLADKLFTPIEGNATSVRSTNSQYLAAITLYYNGKYTEANPIFEQLLESTSGSLKTDITFYYGSSCLAAATLSENNKELLEKAAELFETILQMPANPLYDETRWNLALTYLKMGKKEDCIALLDEIMKTGGYNSQEAKNLFSLLK